MDDEGGFPTGHQTKTHPNQVTRFQCPLRTNNYFFENHTYAHEYRPFSCRHYLSKKDEKSPYFLVCDALQITNGCILEIEDGSPG